LDASAHEAPVFAAFGESAVIVSFGATFEPRTHRRAVAFGRRLEAEPFPGYVEQVPAYTTVCVYFDPWVVAHAPGERAAPYDRVVAWLRERIARWERDGAAPDNDAGGKTVPIPLCYCEACGPDLPALAAAAGLSVSEAVELHLGARYTVTMIGFLPGFPYLSGLSERLSAPRLDTPRAAVPAGSVGIAGRNAGIYPTASPGGWNLIGRTSVRLFLPERPDPSLLEVGDTVVFVRVAHDEREGTAEPWR